MKWLSSMIMALVGRIRAILHQLGLIDATLSRYITQAPHPQHAVDIMKGEWRAKFPEPLANLAAGTISLFEDERINWLVEKTGDIEGSTVLELGPLEGAHSYMLEKLGAQSITAIEANTQAYLKCLIVKELLDLKRARFLCGDFIPYLRQAAEPTFDLCLASGVLYHMQNPVELIALLARRCTKYLFLWTHYYDQGLIAKHSTIAKRHKGQTQVTHHGFTGTLYRYNYREAGYIPGFSGAGGGFSHWMSRDDILSCLNHFGFGEIQIGFEEPQHINGPAFALIASKINR